MEAVRDQSTVRARLSTACRAAGSKQAVSAKTPCMEISSDHASPGRGRGQPATPRPSGRTDDEPYRGEVRLGKHRRISHGLAVVRREDLDPEAERLRELRAWLLVLPEDARYTHVTGAKLLGWDLPKLPEQVPVFAAVHGDPPRPRRAGLICSRLVRPTSSRMTVHDLPIDEPEEILLRAARDLGVLDLLILVCSARRLGHVDTSQMETILASKRPGVRVLKDAWELSHPKSDSAGETVLYLFHRAMGVAVQPQVSLLDAGGRVVGRADLLVTGTCFVQEYDGAVHRTGHQHRTDLRRERGLVGTAYQRRGFTLDDLLNHPTVLMHELDRMLGRRHDGRRLARWRRLVENSLYAEPGRARVLNRWRRAQGLLDWSRTA